jgi:hypothetical protein
VEEYVINNGTKEVDIDVDVDGNDHQDWKSNDVENLVLDQCHNVEQMFRDAMDLLERIHKDAD